MRNGPGTYRKLRSSLGKPVSIEMCDGQKVDGTLAVVTNATVEIESGKLSGAGLPVVDVIRIAHIDSIKEV
jgi:hypothetical protein